MPEKSDESAVLPETFSQEIRELKRWPYVVHVVDETLDAELIEARGRNLLFNALTARNVVGFAGSGLSMSYGRLSWGDWKDRQTNRIKRLAAQYIDFDKQLSKYYQALRQVISHQFWASYRPECNGDQCANKECDRKCEWRGFLLPLAHPDSSRRLVFISPAQFDGTPSLLTRHLHLEISRLAYRQARLERLKESFEHLLSKSRSIGGETIPVQLQVAEQLQSHLKERYERLRVLVESTNAALPIDPFLAWQSEKLNSPQDFLQLFAQSQIATERASDPEVIKNWAIPTLPVGIGRIPDALQEKCWELLDEYRQVMSKCDELYLSAGHPESTHAFEQGAKMLLVDELAHASDYLIQSLDYGFLNGREVSPRNYAEYDHKRVQLYLDKTTLRLIPDVGELAIRKNPARYDILGYFKTEAWQGLLKTISCRSLFRQAPAEWQRFFFSKLTEELRINVDKRDARWKTERTVIAPVNRYLLQCMLCLLKDPLWDLRREMQTEKVGPDLERRGDDPGKTTQRVEISNSGSGINGFPLCFHQAMRSSDFRGRGSLTDEMLDPISTVVNKLGINQFLTTNYDFELERFFWDNGYHSNKYPGGLGDVHRSVAETDRRAHASGSDLHSTHSNAVEDAGKRFRSDYFRRDDPASLFTFGLNTLSGQAGVYHLHGQADDDASCVITENDYLDLYLKNDEYRDTVDEGIRLNFSGNPLLFLGLGMDEPDVLRPLRQFISDKARITTRSAVVLLNASRSRESRDKSTASLYLRYGVHAVYYGDGVVQVGRSNNETGQQACGAKGHEESGFVADLPWLYRTTQLITAIESCIEKIRNDLVELLIEAENPLDLKRLDSLRAQCKCLPTLPRRWHRFISILEALDDPGEVDEKGVVQSIAILFGIEPTISRSHLFGEIGKADSMAAVAFSADANDDASIRSVLWDQFRSALGLSTDLLATVLKMTIRGVEMPGREIDRDRQHFKGFLLGQIRDTNARLAALKGIRGAITTGTLSLALESLEHQRRNWWASWRNPPNERKPRFYRMLPEQSDRTIGSVPTDAKYIQLPVRFVRHKLDNVITQFKDANRVPEVGSSVIVSAVPASEGCASDSQSFDSIGSSVPTGLRAFDNFLNAVETRSRIDAESAQLDYGRRLYMVAASRGVGKGSFLSAFMTEAGLGQYIASSWPTPSAVGHKVKDNRRHDSSPQRFSLLLGRPRYVSAMYINLSFSSEISSTFDMLINGLLYTYAALSPIAYAAPKSDVYAQWRIFEQAWTLDTKSISNMKDEQLKLEILEYLERIRSNATTIRGDASDDVAKVPTASVPDIVLEGLSRTAKLSTLLNHVTDAAQKISKFGLPYPRLLVAISAADLLFENDCRPKNREVAEVFSLLTGQGSQRAPIDVIFVGNEDKMGRVFSTLVSEPIGAKSETEKKQNILNPRFIPIVRKDLSRSGLQDISRRQRRSGLEFGEYATEKISIENWGFEEKPLPDQVPTSQVCFVHFMRVMKPHRLLVDNYFRLAVIFYLATFLRKGNEIGALPIAPMRLNKDCYESCWKESKNIDNFKGLRELSELRVRTDHEVALEVWFKQPRLLMLMDDADQERTVRQILASKAYGRDLVELVRILIGMRFKLESANEDIWTDLRRTLQGNRYCLTMALAAAQRIALTGTTVQDAYHHSRNFIKRIIARITAVGGSTVEAVVLQEVLSVYEQLHESDTPRRDSVLLDLVLKHLAVAGSPCSADVLVRAPQIRRYFDRVLENSAKRRWLRLVEALTDYCERGLIFRVEPNPRAVNSVTGHRKLTHFGQKN